MILADTNIFIDFWNQPTEELKNIFITEDIVICGVVRSELLHGAVSEKDFANITTMLEAFDEFNLEGEGWQTLGENLYNLRRRGVSVPFSDAIIATIALKHGIPIWTGDRHFKVIFLNSNIDQAQIIQFINKFLILHISCQWHEKFESFFCFFRFLSSLIARMTCSSASSSVNKIAIFKGCVTYSSPEYLFTFL